MKGKNETWHLIKIRPCPGSSMYGALLTCHQSLSLDIFSTRNDYWISCFNICIRRRYI